MVPRGDTADLSRKGHVETPGSCGSQRSMLKKGYGMTSGKVSGQGGRHQLCTVNAAYGNQRGGETGRSYRHTLFYCTSLRFTDVVGFHKLKVRPATNRKDYNLLNYDTRFIVVVWNL